MRGVPLAWLRLNYEKRRFFAAVAGITFAVVLMLMQLGLREVLYRASMRIPDHLAGELVMINPQYEFLYALKSFSQRRLYSALASDSVNTVMPIYLQMGTWKDPSTLREHTISVIGAPANRQVLDLPALGSEIPKIGVPDTVLFDVGSRPEFGPIAEMYARGAGLYTEVNDRRVKVVGLFDL